MLHPDSSQRPSLNSLPLLSRINTATKGALDRSLTRHLSHSPVSTPQTTDRAPKIEEITHPSPLLVDSENTDNNSEDQGLVQNRVLRFEAETVPTSPDLLFRNPPPTFSSEPAVEFFTPKTKTSRPSQRWGGEGEAEEKGQSGRKEEGSVWDEPDSVVCSFGIFPRPSPSIRHVWEAERSGEWDGRGKRASGEGERREKEGWMDSPGLSEAMRMEVMEMIAASVGGQGRRGSEEEGKSEGWRRKEKDKRKEERGLEIEQTMGEREHNEQDRSERMEFPQSEDVNVAAVSSLLSSLSSLSLSMKTTKEAMAAELGGFSAFVREWEAKGRDLGNEADNTQLEALMGVLQEEMRKTEELADMVADAEYSECVPLTLSLRLSSLEEQNRSLDVSLSSLASSLCSPTLHSLTKTNIDLRQEWVHAMEEIRMDCSLFLNWEVGAPETEHEKAVAFRSLVQIVKFQPALAASLEVKAVTFIESLITDTDHYPDAFLNCVGRTTGDSLTDFIQSILVLVSSATHFIPTSAMRMLTHLLQNCPKRIRLALVKADLIPQFINTLNPQTLSFVTAENIHMCLIYCITCFLWLATPRGLEDLGIEDHDGQLAVHETVLKQVLAPSEKYVCHLFLNRLSIVDARLSDCFLTLLARLLETSPRHQPTLDFVVRMPVFLTIPGYPIFIEKENSIADLLNLMIKLQQKWDKTKGKERQMWKTIPRMLKMEGFDDVSEAIVKRHKGGFTGGWRQARTSEDSNCDECFQVDITTLGGRRGTLTTRKDSSPAHLSACLRPDRRSMTSLSSQHFVIIPSVPLFPKTNPNRGKNEIAVLSLQPNQHKATPRRAKTDRSPTLPTSPLVTSSPQSPPFSSNTHASTSSPSLTPSVGDVSSLQAQLSKLQSLSSQQQQTITALEKVKETRAGDEDLLKRVIEINKRVVLELKRVQPRLSTTREQSLRLASSLSL
ncbi:hypothetical protein BLNAU_14323 [Blattamonas nauphoetae]|uniref:Uncharacterized protein n=1 Tax=Blattamonas nauphoetae TaxID=2049346 RepID=A0ABQ9XJ76_9EUKA|nr:hypothetical protein BLNAU_14323 [Blattamonas nauphoetae]